MSDTVETAARALGIRTREVVDAKANQAGTIRAKVKSGITFNIAKDGTVTVWDADPGRHTQFARGLSWAQPHPKGPLAKKLTTASEEVEAPAEEGVDAPDDDDEAGWPHKKGGGWWECSDGFSTQDEDEARAHQAELDE